jgi:Flp pilus assembly protein TadD
VAVKLHPDTAWGRIILARAFLAQNYSSEAERELNKAQEIEPGRWDSYFLEGQIALRKKDFVRAINALQQAAKLNPDSAEAHFALATSFWGAKPARLAEARDEFKKCAKLAPKTEMARLSHDAIKKIERDLGRSAASPPALADR